MNWVMMVMILCSALLYTDNATVSALELPWENDKEINEEKPHAAVQNPAGVTSPTSKSEPQTRLNSKGYELYFNGNLVSGPDAAYYTEEQANINCAVNHERHVDDGTKVECRYNGKQLTLPPEKGKQLTGTPGKGYELYFNGNLVSGPDAAYYTEEQANTNCAVNRERYAESSTKVECRYNGKQL